MNYYIQGDTAKADKIKAAFEKLGYSTSLHTFFDEDTVFITLNGNICECNYGGAINELIKTHPDYKELELPVEPKFKVGDWVVFNNSHNSIYQISEIRDSYYMLTHTHGGSMPLSFSQEELLRPWTIEDAKDIDVLAATNVRSCPFIYRKTDHNNNLAYYYAGIDGNGDFCEGCLKRTLFHFGSVSDVVPATKEQRDLLFAKMNEAGYQWDADKKELKKIKHYDIANFNTGMPVLVRDTNEPNERWQYVHFSHYYGMSFYACGSPWDECIPFNNDTKHLLGTTDKPSDEYINW